MATVEELIIQIKADTKGLTAELGKVKQKLDKGLDPKPVSRFGDSIRGLMAPLAAVGGAMVGLTAIQGIARVGNEFEALGITLERIYGSAKSGEKAFDGIRQFAETTPFQLEDVTKAFIQLKSNGIDPTEEMLTIFGDAASAALNPLEAFQAMIRITQRSAGGGLGLEELEQISDQGIPVYKILADRLGVARLEISELGKTAEGAALIMDVLRDGLEKDFGGLMEARMELLETKISNAQIAFKGLGDALFKSGINTFLKDMADRFGAVANNAAAAVRAMNLGISDELLGAIEAPESSSKAVLSQGLLDSQAISKELEGLISQAAFDQANQSLIAMIENQKASLESVLTAVVESGVNRSIATIAFADQEVKSLTASLTELEEGGNERVEAALNARMEVLQDAISKARKEFAASVKVSPDPSKGSGEKREPEDIAREEESKRILKVQKAAAAMAKMFEKTITPAQKLNESLTTLTFLEENVGSQSLLTAEQLGKVRSMLVGLGEDLTSKGLTEQFGSLQSVIGATVTPLETLNAQFQKLREIADSDDAQAIKFIFGTNDPQEVEESLSRVTSEIKELQDSGADAAETFAQTMAPAIAQLSHTFTNDFVNSLLSGKDALESFKSFAKNIVSQIIATFLQMAVVNQILNAVFSTIPGFQAQPTMGFGGGGGGGGGGMTVGGAASGGAMIRGRPYLVGERGPEMFVPHTAGTLKNGNDTKSMVSGGDTFVVNQSLNFSTGVVPTVRAEIQKMLPQISDVTKTAVLESTRRGGTYRKGLLGA